MVRFGILVLEEAPGAVRRSLRGLVHDRKKAWSLKSFLAGFLSSDSSARLHPALPTEKDSGPDPP